MKRRRTIDPAKARAAVMGEVALRGLYSRAPAPASSACARCGCQAGGLGLVEGLCLKCRLKDRDAQRQETAPDTPGPF